MITKVVISPCFFLKLSLIGFDSMSVIQHGTPLPFDTYGAISGVFMLFMWIMTYLFCIILLEGRLMSRKTATVIYLITFLMGGILFVAIPNTLVPFREVLGAIAQREDLWYLLPAILVVTILFGSSILVGRVFCGYACPLGTFQELLSGFNFKYDIKQQRANKYHINISRKFTSKIRWFFLGILFFLAIVIGISILPVIDPFTGFSILRSPFDKALWIPFLILLAVIISSFFFYRPYCRILCPFGAFSAFCGQYAQSKYQRTENCTECGLCEEICPTQEAGVENNKGECYYCNRCIEVCPEDAIILNLDSE